MLRGRHRRPKPLRQVMQAQGEIRSRSSSCAWSSKPRFHPPSWGRDRHRSDRAAVSAMRKELGGRSRSTARLSSAKRRNEAPCSIGEPGEHGAKANDGAAPSVSGHRRRSGRAPRSAPPASFFIAVLAAAEQADCCTRQTSTWTSSSSGRAPAPGRPRCAGARQPRCDCSQPRPSD